MNPATRFVAEFMGDGALFSGKIAGGSEDPVLVTEDGLTFRVGMTTQPSAAATLLLRPEQLRIAPQNPDNAVGLIDAVLEQSVFYGATSKYVCRLKNGVLLTVTPSTSDNDAFASLIPGEALQLAYDREKPHVIHEDRHGA